MALITAADLKAELGITTNDRDARLSRIATAAGEAVKSFLGYDPASTSGTVDINPNGGRVLIVPKIGPRCVLTITTVHVDYANPPTFDANTLLTADTDYKQQTTGSAVVIRLNANWPFAWRRATDRLAPTMQPGCGLVRVVYTVDTAGVLGVAQEAALNTGMVLWNAGTGGGGIGVVNSESVDGLSETADGRFSQGGSRALPQGGLLSPVAARMLQDHRLPVVY